MREGRKENYIQDHPIGLKIRERRESLQDLESRFTWFFEYVQTKACIQHISFFGGLSFYRSTTRAFVI
jgi:hypothetical protein